MDHGTALRPMLDRLAPDEADAFLADCAAPLRRGLSAQAVRHVFPFRRIFVVARK